MISLPTKGIVNFVEPEIKTNNMKEFKIRFKHMDQKEYLEAELWKLVPPGKVISNITQCELSTEEEVSGIGTVYGFLGMGYSKCSVQDQFCKKIGRMRSFKRAVEQIENKEDRKAIWKLYFERFGGGKKYKTERSIPDKKMTGLGTMIHIFDKYKSDKFVP